MKKLITTLFLAMAALTVTASELPQKRQQQLDHLLKQDCGSCHGMTMKGGLGPSLRLDDIQGHTIDSLKATILLGRPGTAMPPWNRLLSEADANYLAEQILAGVGED